MIDQPVLVGEGESVSPVVVTSVPSIRVVVSEAETLVVRDVSAEPRVVQGGDSSIAIVERDALPGMVATGFPGPVGPKGEPGPSGVSSLSAIAATNLTWPMVVTVREGWAALADPFNTEDMQALLAITFQAAMAGQPILLITQGQHSEAAWNWQPGRVFLAPNGGLTQSPDPTGALLEVGRVIDSNTIDFGIQPAILR